MSSQIIALIGTVISAGLFGFIGKLVSMWKKHATEKMAEQRNEKEWFSSRYDLLFEQMQLDYKDVKKELKSVTKELSDIKIKYITLTEEKKDLMDEIEELREEVADLRKFKEISIRKEGEYLVRIKELENRVIVNSSDIEENKKQITDTLNI